MPREGSVLASRNLSVAFGSSTHPVRAVSDVTLSIAPGEIVGIVGESGSGKSTLCSAMLRALPAHARVGGEVEFDGRNLYDLPGSELRALRGREIAMVLQNPMTSLDPLFTIGNQLREVLGNLGAGQRDSKATVRMLQQVHLTAPERRLRQYPHELSGGMKQRILVAMATASPQLKLLVADEPTSALDATIQEEILLLFREVRDRTGAAVVLISHDLGAIRRVCERTVIMYAGRVVEDGKTEDVFSRPEHPYTRGLIASIPQLVDGEILLSSIPGQVPSLAELGPGCAFNDRCDVALDLCRNLQPPNLGTGRHRVFCHRCGQA